MTVYVGGSNAIDLTIFSIEATNGAVHIGYSTGNSIAQIQSGNLQNLRWCALCDHHNDSWEFDKVVT